MGKDKPGVPSNFGLGCPSDYEITTAQHTTLVDAQPDMALIVLAQDLKDRIYAAAHEAGMEPAAWLDAVLENLEGRKA